jgi:hypothetical protein
VYVKVDLAPTPPVVTLEEPEDTKKFHVAVTGGTDWAMVFGAMVDAAAGRLEGDDAYVSVDAVRRLAADQVSDDWDADLDKMIEYAKAKGWYDEASHTIRAHVEWSD